ncbi:MAG: hypothetical protein J0H96_02890 [Microbacterium ginsengisoli]|nr:hypothetical protein [Microbacterium ginsengisoli]
MLQAVRAVVEGRVSRPESSDTPRKAIVQAQHRLTPTEVEEIAAEYRAGRTLPRIAKRWGINRETARLALTRAGEPVRERGTLSPAMLEEARQLEAEGWSLNRLGGRFGIDPKTIKKRLADA